MRKFRIGKWWMKEKRNQINNFLWSKSWLNVKKQISAINWKMVIVTYEKIKFNTFPLMLQKVKWNLRLIKKRMMTKSNLKVIFGILRYECVRVAKLKTIKLSKEIQVKKFQRMRIMKIVSSHRNQWELLYDDK